MTTIQHLLDEYPFLIADSSLCTRLYSFSQLLNLEPNYSEMAWQDARQVLRTYFDHGVRIVLTHTFDANRFKLKLLGFADHTAALNRRAALLTREILAGYSHEVTIAGNIGPHGLSVPHAEAVNAFAEQAAALKQGGVDLIWLESFSSISEAEAAISGVRIGAPDLPIVITFSIHHPQQFLDAMYVRHFFNMLSQDENIIALGADSSHSGEQLTETVARMGELYPHQTLVAKTDLNTLTMSTPGFISTPELIGRFVQNAIRSGARILSASQACTPYEIKAMARAMQYMWVEPQRTPNLMPA